jgi:acyl carrier protein
MATRSEIGASVRGILAREFSLDGDAEAFDETTGLLGKGIGLDSVEVLQVVSAIEEAFGLTIEDDELEVEHFATIGTLVTFIERRL